jgi:hypothetical protein
MKDSLRYLEAAKIEELVDQLSSQGYQVVRPSDADEAPFDLIAEKPGRRLAYNVKAQGHLRGSVEEILARRRYAQEHGIDSTSLVVVNPPHSTDVQIDGIEKALLDYLSEHVPPELERLAERDRIRLSANWKRPEGEPVTRVAEFDFTNPDALDAMTSRPRPEVTIKPKNVEQLEFDSIAIQKERVRAIGTGLLNAVEVSSTIVSLDGVTSPLGVTHLEFPFRFDVVLDRDGKVFWANQIELDTSAYDD